MESNEDKNEDEDDNEDENEDPVQDHNRTEQKRTKQNIINIQNKK